MNVVPFPLAYRTALILDTACGYVERAELHSRAIAFLAEQMNRAATQMVQQGIGADVVTDEMVQLFDQVEARVAALGSSMPAYVKIDVDCIRMSIIHRRADNHDMAG